MSEQQTPLQEWADVIAVCRKVEPGDLLYSYSESTECVVALAAYAERLENHKAALIETVIEYRAQLAARTRWPTGDEAAEQLARAWREWRQRNDPVGWVRGWREITDEVRERDIRDAAWMLQRLREQDERDV